MSFISQQILKLEKILSKDFNNDWQYDPYARAILQIADSAATRGNIRQDVTNFWRLSELFSLVAWLVKPVLVIKQSS